MIDTSEALRDYLLTVPALAAARFYAERDTPPPNYKPADGWAFCFKRRGGGQHYEGVILEPSYQFKCYGATELAANQAYRALYDALDGMAEYLLQAAEMETQGQTLYEPKTNWPYVLVFFKFSVLN